MNFVPEPRPARLLSDGWRMAVRLFLSWQRGHKWVSLSLLNFGALRDQTQLIFRTRFFLVY